MPDMSQPGAHLQELADEMQFNCEMAREEKKKQELKADMYETFARKLRRAIEEENRKQAAGARNGNQ